MSRQKRVYRPLVNPPGQTMAEYALILVTIAVIAAALVTNAGTIVSALVSNVSALF